MWHMLKVVMIMGGPTLLTKMSWKIGYSSGQMDTKHSADDFRACDHFVLNFCKAGMKWLDAALDKVNKLDPSIKTLIELRNRTKNNRIIDFIQLMIMGIMPYARWREALRSGDHTTMRKEYKHWLMLFILTGKPQYARLLILWQMTIEYLGPVWGKLAQDAAIDQMGPRGYYTGADMVIENVNHLIRRRIGHAKPTNDVVKQAAKDINLERLFCKSFEETIQMKRPVEKDAHLKLDASNEQTRCIFEQLKLGLSDPQH